MKIVLTRGPWIPGQEAFPGKLKQSKLISSTRKKTSKHHVGYAMERL